MKNVIKKVKAGDVLNMKQVIEAELPIISNEEYDKQKKEADDTHKRFLDAEEWRKHIKWKTKTRELYAVNIAPDQYKVNEIVTYHNRIDSLEHIQENLDTLFKYHPLLNSFRYESFSQKNEFNDKVYDEDRQPQEIFNFFKRNFNEWCPRIDIKETIQETLNNNTYHYFKNWLDSLVWDGEERLETFLQKYYGAEDTPLNRAYFARWMIALIKRVMEPGAKFDAMLILAGLQGKKKSTLFYWLGTINDRKFYNEAPDNLNDTNNLIYSTKGKVIITFDDFDDICNKGDIGKVKSFITEQSRTAALKWQHEKDYPVTYVLAATTNQFSMLVDDAAFDERRFWIVRVKPEYELFDIPDEIKEQLYAEAYYKYMQDKEQRLWIWEPELKEAEIELQKKYKKASEDPAVELVMSVFNRKYPIMNGKFDSMSHFERCMQKYNTVYNKDLNDTDMLNIQCESDSDIDCSRWCYVTDIPAAWVANLCAGGLGKRSADRIVQILHTQGLKVEKRSRCYAYGCLLTHIFVER